LKVALIGDLFLKNELIKEVIIRYLGKERELEFNCALLNWPEEPFVSGDEVKEYVGSEEEVSRVARNAEIIITQLAPITSRVISACSRLKIIGCCRGGPVNVNVRAATERKIPVMNTPGRNEVAAAEFAVGMILCLLKPILPAHQDLKRGIWRGDFYQYHKCGEEISGKKIGLIGFGKVASRVCKILLAFDARVLVYDPYVEKEKIRGFGAWPTDLETLLKESHLVSLHARLTSETYKLIGEKEISLMRSGAYLVNSARGGLVDYGALYRALKEGRLKGAALDTFDPEPPPPNSPLLKLNNVVLTPHLAGSSRETAHRGIKMLVEDIAKYLRGEIPENCVNPEVFQKR